MLAHWVLRFVESQVWWQCYTAQSNEYDPYGSDFFTSSWFIGESFASGGPIQASKIRCNLDSWYIIVCENAVRGITFEKDIFPPISGLAREVYRNAEEFWQSKYIPMEDIYHVHVRNSRLLVAIAQILNLQVSNTDQDPFGKVSDGRLLIVPAGPFAHAMSHILSLTPMAKLLANLSMLIRYSWMKSSLVVHATMWTDLNYPAWRTTRVNIPSSISPYRVPWTRHRSTATLAGPLFDN